MGLRFVSWNCAGAFREKAADIARTRPDILVVCECEQRATEVDLDFGPLRCRSKLWFGNPEYPTKGLALFSFGDVTLRSHVETRDPLQFFSPVSAEVPGLGEIHVVGVWTTPPGYRQVHDGLSRFRAWVAERDTILLGDFNSSISYHDDAFWYGLLREIGSLDLTSAYHHFRNARFGEEPSKTFRNRNKRSADVHIDYAFVPAAWADAITTVEVGPLEGWPSSDHVPLVVEIDPGRLPERRRPEPRALAAAIGFLERVRQPESSTMSSETQRDMDRVLLEHWGLLHELHGRIIALRDEIRGRIQAACAFLGEYQLSAANFRSYGSQGGWYLAYPAPEREYVSYTEVTPAATGVTLAVDVVTTYNEPADIAELKRQVFTEVGSLEGANESSRSTKLIARRIVMAGSHVDAFVEEVASELRRQAPVAAALRNALLRTREATKET